MTKRELAYEWDLYYANEPELKRTEWRIIKALIDQWKYAIQQIKKSEHREVSR